MRNSKEAFSKGDKMEKAKRVLHFQGRMGKGGAETFMMNAFREIDRSKYIFDFVIYEEYENVRPYHDEINQLGGNIYVVPNPNKNIVLYIKKVKELLNTHHFDIVHNEIYFGGGINLWLAKQAGISKRIAHSHATTDGKGNKFPYNIVRPIFNKLMLKHGTDFLACSNEAGIGLFGDKQPFVFVPNGIDLAQYREVPISKKTIRDNLSLSEDAFVVGHIGRFEEQKNHRLLLQIVKELINEKPNSYLISVGTGTLEKEIQTLAKTLNIESNVLFLGERDDIPELMKAMDVFLMPSLYEGLPMVAVEAQAANLKLVLSKKISPDTMLSENVHFISLDASIEEWVKAIIETPLINKPLPSLEFYDRKNTARMLEKIYE